MELLDQLKPPIATDALGLCSVWIGVYLQVYPCDVTLLIVSVLRIGEHYLDCLSRILVNQLVCLSGLGEWETLSDPARWSDLLQHLPRQVETPGLTPATTYLRFNRTDLAANQLDTVAVKTSTQIYHRPFSTIP